MFVYFDSLGSNYVEFTRTMRGQVSDGSGRTIDAMVPDPERVKIQTRRESLILGPGVNEITEAEFELAKKEWAPILKAKQLRILRLAASGLTGEDAKRQAADITELSIDDAVKMITHVGIPQPDRDNRPQYLGQVGNRDTLYRFLVQDAREEVRQAIRERLALLHLPGPEDTDLQKVRGLLGLEAA